jgi:peptidoglycan/LPS O-acetylase OafA/YrhL
LDDPARSPYVVVAFTAICFGCFWLIALRTKIGDIFSARPLVWIGACSYSIYLIHFEIGASAISTVSKRISLFWQVAAVLGIAMLVIGTGHLLFISVERIGKKIFMRLLPARKTISIPTTTAVTM